MENKKLILILTVILVLLLIVAAVLYSRLSADVGPDNFAQTETDEQAETTKDAANPAPDFTVLDHDGNEVSLRDLLGKPVVLNFWASWCGPCKSEMPDFDAAAAEYAEDVQFMMVNCTDGSRETVDTAKAFVEESGYAFPVYFDTTMEAASTYGASSIPMTFFIDAEGNLIAYGRGAMDAETLQKGIDMLLAE